MNSPPQALCTMAPACARPASGFGAPNLRRLASPHFVPAAFARSLIDPVPAFGEWSLQTFQTLLSLCRRIMIICNGFNAECCMMTVGGHMTASVGGGLIGGLRMVRSHAQGGSRPRRECEHATPDCCMTPFDAKRCKEIHRISESPSSGPLLRRKHTRGPGSRRCWPSWFKPRPPLPPWRACWKS